MTQPVDQPIAKRRETELTHVLTPSEFAARGLARSKYHDRLFVESRPRPTNEQFDEGWDAARQFYVQSVSQPTGSKQGCQKCSSVKWHSKTCVLNKGNDFYGQSLVLDSERSVSDEGRKCAECGHSGNIIGGLCQAVIDRQGKSESCLCRCAFAPCEARWHTFTPSLSDDRHCLFMEADSTNVYCDLPREAEVHGATVRIRPRCFLVEHLIPSGGTWMEVFTEEDNARGYAKDREIELHVKATITPLYAHAAVPSTTRTKEEIALFNGTQLECEGSELRPDGTCAKCERVNARIAAALTTATDEVWERAIAIAGDPYGDEVQCYGSDEPKEVSKKIVAALEAARKE